MQDNVIGKNERSIVYKATTQKYQKGRYSWIYGTTYHFVRKKGS